MPMIKKAVKAAVEKGILGNFQIAVGIRFVNIIKIFGSNYEQLSKTRIFLIIPY